MKDGLFYLNNNGTRWVELVNGKNARREFKTTSGRTVTRAVNFYETFGNFGTCNISWKGKKVTVFTDTILQD